MSRERGPSRAVSRREWLRSVGLASAGLALTKSASFARAGDRPPNVILILADDLGSRDLGCYGAGDLDTPILDTLADRGVRFEQFYVTAPACLPSRASLMTGRHPQHVLEPGVGMSSSAVTLAELLRSAGYRTAVFGKWHLGSREEASPLEQGFDRFVGFKFGAIDNYSHYDYWSGGASPAFWRESEMRGEAGAYFPDIVTDEAVQFIGTNRDHPFFLYLPYNIPHYPLQSPSEIYARYEHLDHGPRRFYGAFVSAMDERIGRVLQAVGDNGLTRDTIIVFLSDHGHSEEAPAMGGGGRATPYRGGKATLWEGGIRVPCIVAWPGTLPAGQVRHQPSSSIDWLPTIAEWCGVPLLGLEIDGHSLRAVIETAQAVATHETLFWTWDGWTAVRDGPWKLVVDGDGSGHLYNLASDPGERRNLLVSQTATAQRLAGLREAWFQQLRRDPNTRVWLPRTP
jgi:arylsulfatase A